MDGTMIHSSSGSRKSWSFWLLLAVVVLALAAGAALLVTKKLMGKVVAKSDYQAVFLTNGQVYFGKLNANGRWAVLTDVYYLQVADDLQPASSSTVTPETPAGTTPSSTPSEQKINLVKLGSELHGPQDEMFIDRDKILFWENMKDDSKVLQSIKTSQNR